MAQEEEALMLLRTAPLRRSPPARSATPPPPGGSATPPPPGGSAPPPLPPPAGSAPPPLPPPAGSAPPPPPAGSATAPPPVSPAPSRTSSPSSPYSPPPHDEVLGAPSAVASCSSQEATAASSDGRIQLQEGKVFVQLGAKEQRDPTSWICDTGATNHMTGSRAAFADLDTAVSGSVWFGDDSMAEIEGRGTVLFKCKNGEHRSFTGVYYIPRLTANIVSLGQLEEADYDVHLRRGGMEIREPEGRLLARIPRAGNRLYVLNVDVARPVCLAARGEESAWRWHARLGHINMLALRKMAREELVRGLPSIEQGAPPGQMGASYPRMFLVLLLLHGASAALNPPTAGPKWQTLSGRPPQVVARGGFSGLFPDSSQMAYQLALSTSLPDVVLLCDLQFSSDRIGFCKTGLTLDNSTTVAEIFPKMDRTYKLQGEDVHGWFSLDFTAEQLVQNVTLIQNIFSRPSTFDASFGMYTLDDVVELHPPQIWLNVEYNSFFMEHKLSSEDYILELPKDFSLTYISSPEIGFLKSLSGKLRNAKTKLIFRFLNEDVEEPSTKKTYGELLKDLKSIKEFAAGVLVPKTYIWPLKKDQYLAPSTSLVKDAHALGLEVYASGFANDIILSYNYSYDPTAEYLQFIDNPDFSVDGVITDFPPTASGAVACLAHSKGNPLPPPGKDTRPLIITHNGASGMFAGSTDLAYQQAIKDAADVIDCTVQMSKDGTAFCMQSADMSSSTTASTAFASKASTVHEIQNKSGIFSFDLSWSEIATLKRMKRNPQAKNAGKLMTVPQFLDLAKASNITGILIEIEHASYLAKRGIGVVEAVSSALTKAGYDKETKQQVFIQSDDSSVLAAFKKFTTFRRVLNIEAKISGASKPSVDDIKKFADTVRINRNSVAQVTGYFMTHFTDTVSSLQDANLTVFLGVLKNEFMNLGFDFFADPTIEIVTYSWAVLADGLVTDYPATAASYFRSPCSDMNLNLSYSILPAQPGALVNLAAPGTLAPAGAPAPLLQPSDVVDPPLPPVKAVITADAPAPEAADNTSSASSSNAGNGLLWAAIVALLSLSFLR
ncbi:glycerophosphodiester phosphodiesterase GDPDL7-like isoform X1 [Zea mays]|nr:uncharacterized protein LOC100304242 isoform X1 [Zea mays]|eukprot:XP_020407206.1 uncharacterized protein LOC100304242 isoform X2 [Zea mays]